MQSSSINNRVQWFTWLCWLGVVIWTATVYYLSSCNNVELTEDFPFIIAMWDKFLHFAAFMCGAFPLAPALRLTWRMPWRRVFWVTVVALSLYGGADEYHQTFTPGRGGKSPGDWLADTLGALVGAGIAILIHGRIERIRTNRSTPAGN